MLSLMIFLMPYLVAFSLLSYGVAVLIASYKFVCGFLHAIIIILE